MIFKPKTLNLQLCISSYSYRAVYGSGELKIDTHIFRSLLKKMEAQEAFQRIKSILNEKKLHKPIIKWK